MDWLWVTKESHGEDLWMIRIRDVVHFTFHGGCGQLVDSAGADIEAKSEQRVLSPLLLRTA